MNERRGAPSHSISALFVFLLLSIFAVFSLVLVVFSAQAYKNTVDHTSAHNEQRILSSFIRNNLRTADMKDGISFDAEGETPRLVIADPEDSEYVKYIYVYDGRLCELYTEAEKEFSPAAGEVICAADSLDAQIADGMITVNVSANGEDHVTVFTLRCEEGRT